MYTFTRIERCDDVRRTVRIQGLRWNARRIPRSHGPHVIGHHSPGPGCPLVAFESLVEQRAIATLLALPGVHFVLSQPFTIDYQVNGRRRRYTPDLLVAALPVPAFLRRHGFEPLSIVEFKLHVDPYSRSILDFRLRVVHLATGLPVFLGTPKISPAAGEVDHVA